MKVEQKKLQVREQAGPIPPLGSGQIGEVGRRSRKPRVEENGTGGANARVEGMDMPYVGPLK